MFKFRKNTKNQEVKFDDYPVGLLRDAASFIWGNQFSEALAYLNAYFISEDKSQEEGSMAYHHSMVLALAEKIIANSQASIDARMQAFALCKTIYSHWIEVYGARAEDAEAQKKLDYLTQEYRSVEYYVTHDLEADNLFQNDVEINTLEIAAEKPSEEVIEKSQAVIPEEVDDAEVKNKRKEKRRLAKVFMQKGDDAFTLKYYTLAAANYEISISNNPNMPKAHFNLAKCFKRLGEEYREEHRLKTRDLPEDSKSARQIFIFSPNSKEMEFYKKSEAAFEKTLELQKEVNAEFYWEYADLREAQGEYDDGAECRRKACQLERKNFSLHYSGLINSELKAQQLQVVFRYAFIMRDQEFKNYCQKNVKHNYQLNLYLGCGFTYASYGENNAAFQQYLLAWNSCGANNVEREFVLGKVVADIRSSVDITILSNIFGLTTDEELASIKLACKTFIPAYIKLIQHDLVNQKYEEGVKKFLIIAGDDFFHQPMDAEFLCQIGLGFTKIQRKDLNAALACYNAAHRKDPEYSELKSKREQLLALKRLQVKVAESKTYAVGRASPVMYKDNSNSVCDYAVEGVNNKSINLGCNPSEPHL